MNVSEVPDSRYQRMTMCGCGAYVTHDRFMSGSILTYMKVWCSSCQTVHYEWRRDVHRPA